MFCPFCQTEYNAEDPCFCHPAPQQVVAAPEAKMSVALPSVPKPLEPPTGLDNPFWRPEAADPAAIRQAPSPKRIASFS